MVGPYGSLHLAAVHTPIACEVEHYRHVVTFGVCHTLFIVVELGLHISVVEAEILGVHGRCKGAYCLAGCAPQSGNHIQGKGKRKHGHEKAGN